MYGKPRLFSRDSKFRSTARYVHSTDDHAQAEVVVTHACIRADTFSCFVGPIAGTPNVGLAIGSASHSCTSDRLRQQGMDVDAAGSQEDHQPKEDARPALTETLSLAQHDVQSRAESICAKVCSRFVACKDEPSLRPSAGQLCSTASLIRIRTVFGCCKCPSAQQSDAHLHIVQITELMDRALRSPFYTSSSILLSTSFCFDRTAARCADGCVVLAGRRRRAAPR